MKLVLPPRPLVPLSLKWQPLQVLSENWWRPQMLAAGEAAVMVFASQWPGGMSELPPRNCVPPKK